MRLFAGGRCTVQLFYLNTFFSFTRGLGVRTWPTVERKKKGKLYVHIGEINDTKNKKRYLNGNSVLSTLFLTVLYV